MRNFTRGWLMCCVVLATGCPPDCPTGQKDDLSSWVALSSAYIVVPAHKVACIGEPFSGGIDSGKPLSLRHFITDKRADGSIVLEGLVPTQSQPGSGMTSISKDAAIRLGIADCPAGSLTIDYMIPHGEYQTIDVPYARHGYDHTTYDSATDPGNSGTGHLVKLDRDTAFCFTNDADKDVRVLFEAFLPQYTCIPESQPASKITAGQAALPPQSCPVVVHTCSGAVATSSAANRSTPIIDAIGCGNTWVAFANDDAEVKQCATLAGYHPVEDVCLYEVQYYNNAGSVETDVASDSSADAVNCARFEPGGCTNCDAIVLGEGACLSGAR
ncbi:MAG: hypothetical protein ABJE66_04415 [Deltaproteobacteria bacterium]